MTDAYTASFEQLPSLEECMYGISVRDRIQSFDDDDESRFLDDDQEDDLPPLETIEHTVDLQMLRQLASQGLADEGHHRGVVWRVLLKYLPLKVPEWPATLRKQRAFYEQCLSSSFHENALYELQQGHVLRNQRIHGRLTVTHSSEDREEDEGRQNYQAELPDALVTEWRDAAQRDVHVLQDLCSGYNALKIPETDDDYAELCDSAKLLDDIRKDVKRTHTDLSFYLHPFLGNRRYAALERILFVYGKYHKGLRYVQGMNEIVGTIYYVLANDRSDWFHEADVYYLLSALLEEFRDVFMPDLDEADTGLQGRLQALDQLLERHDPELYHHMNQMGCDTHLYAIRWWTTMLSREFLLPDVIRLWDSLLSSKNRENFLKYVCVTMIMNIRDQLLVGDFGVCLRLLQDYPSTHMDRLLEASQALWMYESKILMTCHKGGLSLHQAMAHIPVPSSVVMAFGIRNTTEPPTSNGDFDVEEAKEQAIKAAREAKDVIEAKARNWFGKASRFYRAQVLPVYEHNKHRLPGWAQGDEAEGGEQAKEQEPQKSVPLPELTGEDAKYLDLFADMELTVSGDEAAADAELPTKEDKMKGNETRELKSDGMVSTDAKSLSPSSLEALESVDAPPGFIEAAEDKETIDSDSSKAVEDVPL